MDKARSIATNITLVVGSILLVFLVLEVVLRLFNPQVFQATEMFEPDEHLGWRFIPESRGYIVYDGGAGNFVETNSDGFRDDEFTPTPDSIKTVLVFGDSFVTNMSVEASNVFTEVIQAKLAGTDVRNLGVNGFGQVQQYLMLRERLERTAPDLVIFVVYVRNDFLDNVGANWKYPRPYATLRDDGQSVELHAPEDANRTQKADNHTIRSFIERSHSYVFVGRRIRFVYSRYVDRQDVTHAQTNIPEIYLCSTELNELIARMDAVMEEMLVLMADYCAVRGIRSAFLVAPSLVQVQNELWDQLVSRDDVASSSLSRSLPNTKIVEMGERNGIKMMDLLPVLLQRCNQGESCYNRLEQHWTAYANRVVADTVANFIAVSFYPLRSNEM